MLQPHSTLAATRRQAVGAFFISRVLASSSLNQGERGSCGINFHMRPQYQQAGGGRPSNPSALSLMMHC